MTQVTDISSDIPTRKREPLFSSGEIVIWVLGVALFLYVICSFMLLFLQPDVRHTVVKVLTTPARNVGGELIGLDRRLREVERRLEIPTSSLPVLPYQDPATQRFCANECGRLQ